MNEQFNKIPFSSKIKKLRKEKGFSLEQLAKLTGSSKSYIWEIEKDEDKEILYRKFSSLNRNDREKIMVIIEAFIMLQKKRITNE